MAAYARLESAHACANALAYTVGPIIVGSVWLGGLQRPTPEGYVLVDGERLGTNVYLLTSYSGKRAAFRMQPALGVEWGQAGRAWLPRTELEILLNTGEALIARVRP